MKNRNEIDWQQDKVHEDPSNYQIEHEVQTDRVLDDRVLEVNSLINDIDNEQEVRTVIRVKDEERENIFKHIL